MHGSLWFSCYLLTGTAILVQYVREAYIRAVDMCELYPNFDFSETLREELWDHTTVLPVVYKPVATLVLLLLYALAYVVMRFNVVEIAWLLLVDVLSGRWLHHALFVTLPAYVPLLASEPGVPELISDGEQDDVDDDGIDDVNGLHDHDATADEFRAHFGDDAAAAIATRTRVSARECRRALAKLVQVKHQFADCRIERPDDWLVFDPLAAELVPRQQRSSTTTATTAETASTTIRDGSSSATRTPECVPERNGFATSDCNATTGRGRDIETLPQQQQRAVQRMVAT